MLSHNELYIRYALSGVVETSTAPPITSTLPPTQPTTHSTQPDTTTTHEGMKNNPQQTSQTTYDAHICIITSAVSIIYFLVCIPERNNKRVNI